jgi:hypothetical protein
MYKSLQPLGMMVFIVLIGCIVFSSAIYFVERGEYSTEYDTFINASGGVSQFQSIPESMWWCIITMTTVGYGDVVPITGLGKFIATIAALSGILVLAIPITIISTNFNEEYDGLRKEKEIAKLRVQMLKEHFTRKRFGAEAMSAEVSALIEVRASINPISTTSVSIKLFAFHCVE